MLRTLVVASYPNDSFDTFQLLPELTYLFVLHLPIIETLGPVIACRRLETLRLHTLPSWDTSGKQTVVDSLAPLGRLYDLRHVELFGVVPRDESLRPLERCPTLKSLRVQGYPRQEVARFYLSSAVSRHTGGF